MKTINNPKGLGYVVGFDYKGARGTSRMMGLSVS